jgi:hypothetical protein
MALTREFFLLEEIITSDRERAILTSKKILNILARSSKEKPFFFYRAQLDNLLGRLVQKTGFTRYFTCRWFGCLVFLFLVFRTFSSSFSRISAPFYDMNEFSVYVVLASVSNK